MKRFIPLSLATLLMPAMAFSQVIVDDSWAIGTRTSPPNDAAWWTSTSSQAIEVGPGYLGLVSGTSGRGIHGTFTPQTLNIGDTLTATFTFTTPDTVGVNRSTGLRFGFFDTTGKPGLAADLSASSGSPNPIYDGLPGYMMDWDLNTGSENIFFREHDTTLTSGQLMSQTGDYISLSGGGNTYSFFANTTYTGVMSVKRTGADTLDLTGTLFQGSTELSTHTATDSSGIVNSFGMLGLHMNSNTFGSSNVPGDPNNGVDFTNVKIEFFAVPEPSSSALLLTGLLVLGRSVRRRARA
jgi:hypothetical protein